MKKVCLITGSRAEYGILKPLIHQLNNDAMIQLDIIATAMHMEERYGYTYRVIEQDGFLLAHTIPLNLHDTTRETVVNSMSILQVELSKWFQIHEYDLLVILGDRYEMLAVANVALIYRIPICHLHGGEKTLGNFDESIRHAITKMSHLHLVAAEEYQQRVLQLGENPEWVIHTGALGVENVEHITKLSKQQLEEQLRISLNDRYYVVLFHPVTLETDGAPLEQIKEVLCALEEAGEQYVFIGSNSDTGSDVLMNEINQFVDRHADCYLFASLTTQQYHSLVHHATGLIGNSSSGLIEVPSLHTPTLNIGDRQKGRLRGNSVIDVPVKKEAILNGMSQLEKIHQFDNPYQKDHASKCAYEAICRFLQTNPTAQKDFFDGVQQINKG